MTTSQILNSYKKAVAEATNAKVEVTAPSKGGWQRLQIDGKTIMYVFQTDTKVRIVWAATGNIPKSSLTFDGDDIATAVEQTVEIKNLRGNGKPSQARQGASGRDESAPPVSNVRAAGDSPLGEVPGVVVKVDGKPTAARKKNGVQVVAKSPDKAKPLPKGEQAQGTSRGGTGSRKKTASAKKTAGRKPAGK